MCVLTPLCHSSLTLQVVASELVPMEIDITSATHFPQDREQQATEQV